MKKTLVYHLPIFEGFEENRALKIHKACLKFYAHIFDEMRFVLAFEDLNNEDLITKAMAWVAYICKGKRYIIKIVDNNPLYETNTFKEEILDKIDEFDGAVFFGHAKGITRVSGNDDLNSNIESIERWIIGLYFFSLHFIDEVEARFLGHQRASEIFYGPFLTMYKDPSVSPMLRLNKNNCFYQGTFFWINVPKFRNYVKKGILTIPEVDDRYFTEMLPGVLCGRELYGDGLASHKDVAINDDFNLYKMGTREWENLSYVLGEPWFVEFSDSIIREL